MTTTKQILQNFYQQVGKIKALEGCTTKIDTDKEFNNFKDLLLSTKSELCIWEENQKNILQKKGDRLSHSVFLNKEEEINNDFLKYLAELDRVELSVNKEYEELKKQQYETRAQERIIKKQNKNQKGYIPARIEDRNKNIKGLKLYKNNKKVFTDPDFVADNLGLRKNNLWNETKEFVKSMIPGYTRITKHHPKVTSLQDDQYVDDSWNVYSWNSEKNQFDYKYNLAEREEQYLRP